MKYFLGGMATGMSIISVVILAILAANGAAHFENGDLAAVLLLVTLFVMAMNVAHTVGSVWRWMDDRTP